MTFKSNVNYDNGYTNNPLGEHEYTMELFQGKNNQYVIEWDIPELEMTEHIGIWCTGTIVTDYDGVFEIPKQAIELLQSCGFSTKEIES